MKLEFITEKRLNHMNQREVFDFILDRVLEDRILLIERNFNDSERLELIALGLERATTDTSMGINMTRIPFERKERGLLRKSYSSRFNLFTPGNSIVKQMEDGHFTINSFDGKTIAHV